MYEYKRDHEHDSATMLELVLFLVDRIQLSIQLTTCIKDVLSVIRRLSLDRRKRKFEGRRENL